MVTAIGSLMNIIGYVKAKRTITHKGVVCQADRVAVETVDGEVRWQGVLAILQGD